MRAVAQGCKEEEVMRAHGTHGCDYGVHAYLFGVRLFLHSAHNHLLECAVFFVIAIFIVLQHAFQPTLSLCTCHFEVALCAAKSTPWPAVLPRRWWIPIGPYISTLNEAHTRSLYHALTFNVPHFFSRRLAALAMSQMAGRVSE